MSFVKIWIHAVWTTKKRQPILSKELRNYIQNQEVHHQVKTWEEEYNEFIENYGFKIING